MCGEWLCDVLPQTTVHYTVTYCHTGSDWHARVWSHSTLRDGEEIRGGTTTYDFGPFDTALDVAQWLVREVHAHTKTQSKPIDFDPQDPPQGRTAPES